MQEDPQGDDHVDASTSAESVTPSIPPKRGQGKGRPTREEFYANPERMKQGVTAQRLAGLGLQDEDIASYLGIKVEKLVAWFKKELNLGRVQRKILIAKGQMKLVEYGDREMLKILGEVELGQGRTRQQPESSGTKQFFQIVVGERPKMLDGPPPPPVRKLVSCGEAKLSEPAADEPASPFIPSAASLLRKARESIDATFAED